MEIQEILEYNKRCAEFIGATPCKDWQGEDGYEHPNWYHTQWSNRYQDNLELYSYRYSQLKFHSDWNWIIEVLNKIKPLVCEAEFTNRVGLHLRELQKEKVIEGINQFLIWYNENK